MTPEGPHLLQVHDHDEAEDLYRAEGTEFMSQRLEIKDDLLQDKRFIKVEHISAHEYSSFVKIHPCIECKTALNALFKGSFISTTCKTPPLGKIRLAQAPSQTLALLHLEAKRSQY